MRLRASWSFVAAAVVLASASVAVASMYSYRDDSGAVHFVDSPEKIPARYRGQARADERSKPREVPPPRAAASSDAPSPADGAGGGAAAPASPGDGDAPAAQASAAPEAGAAPDASAAPEAASPPVDPDPPRPEGEVEEPEGTCSLERIGKPKRLVDPRDQRVTYAGQVKNSGQGRAERITVRLRLFDEEGAMLDERENFLVPSMLMPGETGRFEISATYGQYGARDGERDQVEIQFTRCRNLK